MYPNLKNKKKIKKIEENSNKGEKKKRNGRRERQKQREKREERESRERNSTFSLRYMEIGPWVFIGVRGKVDPLIASYVWVPKSWSFVKHHEVGNFPTWIISTLKAI